MKTLIILDTNKIRSTSYGRASYGSFEFGAEFISLDSYIKDNGLTDFVKIAVPSLAMQELLQQKAEQYSVDLNDISGIKTRLSELPGVDFSQVSLPASSFDCREHLKPRMEDFVQKSELTVIDIEEEKFGKILKQVLKRAIERRPPFKQGGKSTDIGFKDVMIWESILNYANYADFDDIVLFTADAGFDKECKEEFESRIKKPLMITSSLEILQDRIEQNYPSVIRNKEWTDFVRTDYFKSYLAAQIANLKNVSVNGIERKVIRVDAVVDLDRVEEPEDDGETAVVLVSLLKGTVDINGHAKELRIKARTFLDDAKDFQFTEFMAQ